LRIKTGTRFSPIFHSLSARGRVAAETVPSLTLGVIWTDPIAD
jgi:hypothetical protein